MDPRDLFNSFFVSGGYLPLDKRERHLASIVFPVALAEVCRAWGEVPTPGLAEAPAPGFAEAPARGLAGGAPGGNQNFDVKVEAARENLANILDLFDKIHLARDGFLSSFPRWKKMRKGNTGELEEVGHSLHTDRLNCNISRLVGSSVGVLGAGALLGCLLFPPAAAVVLPLSLAGGGAALAGGGVIFGTTATEYGLIKQKMTKAQKILEKDQKCFQPMANYFEHTIAFVAAVDAIFGFQVMVTLATDLKEFVDDVRRWNNLFLKQLKGTFAAILSAIPIASMGAQLTSIALTFCVVAVLAHKKNNVILGGVILTHRLVFGLLSGLDLGVEIGRAVVALLRGGKLAADMSSQLARAVFHGVFGGVGLTLDVINIVLTSIDVHRGSLSRQGTMVLDAASKLGEELEFLEKVYNELR